MSVKYEILKAIVKKAGIKNSLDLPAEEIIEAAKKQNAKTKIPKISDKEIGVSRIYVKGYPVVIRNTT